MILLPPVPLSHRMGEGTGVRAVEVERAGWASPLRLDRESGLFRQRSLSLIERDELLGPEHEGGRDVDNVERAAAEYCGVAGGKLLGLLFDGGSGVSGPLPAPRGDVLLECGDGAVHFRWGDFSTEGLQPDDVLDLQRLPLRQRVRCM